MLLDARDLEEGTVLETDVCIVGAGAAGITLATELRGSGLDVVLLESGGRKDEPETHRLYDGPFEGPFEKDNYCLDSRCRFFGGTTNRWTGTCRPFDDIDFEHRPWVHLSGWPIRRDGLDDYFTRAAEVLDSPVFREHRGDGQLTPHNTLSEDGEPGRLVPKAMYRSQPVVRFGKKYRQVLEEADDLRVILHANVTELVANAPGTAVTEARIAVLCGPRVTLRAKRFVVATGGVENARLLLASNSVIPGGLGNQHGNLGRYFMDHARLRVVGHLMWTGPKPKGSLGQRIRSEISSAPKWFYIMYSPSTEVQRREQMLNCGFRLMGSQVGHVDPLTVDAHRLAAAVDRHPGGPGLREAAPKTAFKGIKFYIEHTPNRESRVMLDDTLDPLGKPRTRVRWRISDSDVDQIYRTLDLLGREVGAASRGRLRITVDRDRIFQEQGFLGSHPMGTTRMTDDPKRGVVDPDCRVHGLGNLYVAGSSVFPTGGFANPTMTLVALALRLADHLKATPA